MNATREKMMHFPYNMAENHSGCCDHCASADDNQFKKNLGFNRNLKNIIFAFINKKLIIFSTR